MAASAQQHPGDLAAERCAGAVPGIDPGPPPEPPPVPPSPASTSRPTSAPDRVPAVSSGKMARAVPVMGQAVEKRHAGGHIEPEARPRLRGCPVRGAPCGRPLPPCSPTRRGAQGRWPQYILLTPAPLQCMIQPAETLMAWPVMPRASSEASSGPSSGFPVDRAFAYIGLARTRIAPERPENHRSGNTLGDLVVALSILLLPDRQVRESRSEAGAGTGG